MEKNFLKTDFSKAPGGHGYIWKKATTNFDAPIYGKYVIAVTASAVNAKSKNSSDDDLRLALDGYEFGKYEKHDEKTSWNGFGTAASENGNTYKVQIRLFDVYDFNPKQYELNATWLPVHMADVLETSLILKNFEIEIDISDIFYV